MQTYLVILPAVSERRLVDQITGGVLNVLLGGGLREVGIAWGEYIIVGSNGYTRRLLDFATPRRHVLEKLQTTG